MQFGAKDRPTGDLLYVCIDKEDICAMRRATDLQKLRYARCNVKGQNCNQYRLAAVSVRVQPIDTP